MDESLYADFMPNIGGKMAAAENTLRILEGFRPGRIVRVRPQRWPNVKPPVEERVRSFEDCWPSPDLFRK